MKKINFKKIFFVSLILALTAILSILLYLLPAGFWINVTAFFQILWNWTGFPNKSLWDWMALLIIPVVLAIGGFLFNKAERKGQNDLAEKKENIERGLAEKKENAEKEITTDRWRETAMQAYLDKITELILEKDLLLSKQNEGVRHLVRARTLTIMPTLNQERQRTLLGFLYEAKLIENNDPIINFTNVDLSGADLGFFLLRGANLKRINLRKANIRGADLSSSNFRMAIFEDAILAMTNLKMANLQQVNFIKADFIKAELDGADLTGANLIRASLKSASLITTILNGVNLTLANLEKANLKGAIIDDKTIVCDTVMPDGSIANSVEEFRKFI